MAVDLPPLPPAHVMQCAVESAQLYQLPLEALLALRGNEKGETGKAHANKNSTVDVGEWQINTVWLKHFWAKFRIPPTEIKDNLCTNAKAAGYIVRYYMEQNGGNLWRALGDYHSKTPELHWPYRQKVERLAFHFQQELRKSNGIGY